MNDVEFAQIIQLITKSTGIIPRDSHTTGIKNYVEKRSEEISSEKKAVSYFDFLKTDADEMRNLIDYATVNETYFFREEAQFEVLQNRVFPELVEKCGKKIKIWSAASSSGEEIYSLYLLAKSMGICTDCIASDINTRMLSVSENGFYKKKALRTVDGAKFHCLLEEFKDEFGNFHIPSEICSDVEKKRINLARLMDYPKDQDIVFVRNVFIYFSLEMKKKVLEKIVSESLAPGGYLFVSMNEVAGLDKTILPNSLEKLSEGKVFYFRKKNKEDVWDKISKL